MPVLSNIKWERFAEAIADGVGQTEAVKISGFLSSNSSSQYQVSYKLLKKQPIIDRIAELKAAKEQIIQLGVSQAQAVAIPSILAERALVDITTVNGRVEKMKERFALLEQIQLERAQAFSREAPEVPGVSSGLIIKVHKQLGKQLVTAWETDYGFLKEMREIERAISQSLGQLIERKEQVITAQQVIENTQLFNELLRIIVGDPPVEAQVMETKERGPILCGTCGGSGSVGDMACLDCQPSGD